MYPKRKLYRAMMWIRYISKKTNLILLDIVTMIIRPIQVVITLLMTPGTGMITTLIFLFMAGMVIPIIGMIIIGTDHLLFYIPVIIMTTGITGTGIQVAAAEILSRVLLIEMDASLTVVVPG